MALLGCCLLTANLSAQAPTPEEWAKIHGSLEELRNAIETLQHQEAKPRDLADVEVYAKAADWIMRHEEFYRPDYAKATLDALATGQARAKQLADGETPWGTSPGRWILAYRSAVDDSVQPYAVSLPVGFNRRDAKRWPLHLVLHGRGGTLNEVSFIRSHDGKDAKEDGWIQLDVFGRINNAYRWAGETDVFEALADVIRRYRIDEKRITLWGFSMGGAGAWHLGLHHPSRWSSVGAGAGFVDFYEYQKQTEELPGYQHRALRIYDAVDYAENLAAVPFITYGGELDAQLAASLTMQSAAQEADVPVQVLVGPGMGHKFDAESLAKFMAFHAEHSESGRPSFPGRKEFRFVTYTTKYNRCEWATIIEMGRMFERASLSSRVDDDGNIVLTTGNVTALSITRGVANAVKIDGSKSFDLNNAAEGLLPDVYFVNDGDGWELLDYEASLAFVENPEGNKRHDLQGPIDDAFTMPFVCVRGTGTPWSTMHQAWADQTLARFEREWDKWMRGKVRVIDDTDVTDELIASHHLVLFGDPASNSVLARVVDSLPVTWTKETIEIGGGTYAADSHGVAMIHPNPLNPMRYVVINSGMTTHEKDFKASNAWLFPKLGDAAVIHFEPAGGRDFTEMTVWAALYDNWPKGSEAN